MLTRRGFFGRMLSGSALATTATLLESSRSYAGPASPPPEQENAVKGDWINDPRWGRENWKSAGRQVIEWPNKARIAFLCSIPLETYDVTQNPNQDSGRVSWYYYGSKIAVWRILDILDRHNVKGNFVTNSLCAVQFPDAVKAIVQRGHEIVGHFWANNLPEDKMTVERDTELIRRSISTIQELTGKRPVAWVAPGWNAGTRSLEILAEEGMTSHANSPSSGDLPFTVNIGGKKVVVVVQETVLNDYGFFDNFNSPSTYLTYLKKDFDRKYAEGATSPKLFNFVIHAHNAGRPYMAEALEEIISYARSFPDVWFTTRQPIVDWWLKNNYS